MHALGRLAVFDAFSASQLHADARKQGQACSLVPHPKQSCVEVDLGCQCRYGDQARVPDKQERCHGLVEESRLNVGRLFENDEVSTGTFGGRYLRQYGVYLLDQAGACKMSLETLDRLGVPVDHPFCRQALHGWWYVPARHEHEFSRIMEFIWTRTVTPRLASAMFCYCRMIIPRRDYRVFRGYLLGMLEAAQA